MIFYVVSTVPAALEAQSVFTNAARGADAKTSDGAGMWLKLDGGQ
jgi:hypothetical protein